jgi:host factor-I protein
VVLEANGQEQLIFKHAISTVVMGRTVSHGAHLAHTEAKAAAAPGAGSTSAPTSTSAAAPVAASASAASASGTEG